MGLLLFSSLSNRARARLQKLLEALCPCQRIKTCRTISSLSARLCQPKHNLDAAVLFAATKDELDQLFSINDLIDDLRIVLVVPDRESDTILKGHILRPRFLTDVDSDFSDIAAVLKKMLATHCHKERGRLAFLPSDQEQNF